MEPDRQKPPVVIRVSGVLHRYGEVFDALVHGHTQDSVRRYFQSQPAPLAPDRPV